MKINKKAPRLRKSEMPSKGKLVDKQ